MSAEQVLRIVSSTYFQTPILTVVTETLDVVGDPDVARALLARMLSINDWKDLNLAAIVSLAKEIPSRLGKLWWHVGEPDLGEMEL